MLAGRGEKSDILSPVLLHAVKIFIWVLPEGVVKVPRLKREISADIRFTCFLSKSQYFMIIKDYLSIKGGKKEEGCYINKVKKKKNTGRRQKHSVMVRVSPNVQAKTSKCKPSLNSFPKVAQKIAVTLTSETWLKSPELAHVLPRDTVTRLPTCWFSNAYLYSFGINQKFLLSVNSDFEHWIKCFALCKNSSIKL